MMRLIIILFMIGVTARSQDSFRLPGNFKPVNYQLKIITHLGEESTFEGLVDIKVNCVKETDTVVLHSSDNLIIDTKQTLITSCSDEKSIKVEYLSFNSANEMMCITLSETLKSGSDYVITIPFTGTINDDLVGYYKSYYVDKETNEKRWLAVTQFEAANARRAFPCFDEPALKATFKITLGHKKDLSAVSNMRLIKTTPMPSCPDYVLDEFEESVPMSTYLVAYMVSDFVYVDSENHETVPFRILVRKDAVEQAKLASELGPKVLKYYETLFDEKFALCKVDMAAIPDMDAGAMENWGLVTYKETVLLFDPKVSSIEDQRLLAVDISHELSHQWFGNLVTMEWWSDLWLNEGFAMYIEIIGTDFLYPEWNSFQLAIAENFGEIMNSDSLQSSHPVSAVIENPEEIEEIFDDISYSKGMYILYMLSLFIGEDAFMGGVRNYIKKYKFSNAQPDDLWNCLTEEAQRRGCLDEKTTAKQIMDVWTLQTGYPVLKVDRDYSTGIITLSQERYLQFKSTDGEDQKNIWWIPLTMTTSTEADFTQTKAKTMFNVEKSTQQLSFNKDDKWVIFNLQLSGLYRVLYDTRNWMGIIETLNDPQNFQKIHTLNRVQLVSDSLSFSRRGDLDYKITFQLLNYLKHETEFAPWMTASDNLSLIFQMMKRTPKLPLFQKYMQCLTAQLFSKYRDFTVEFKDFNDKKFKINIINEACRYGAPECIDEVKKLFNSWMASADPDKNNVIPNEQKPIVYCQALKWGGQKEWQFLWERYEAVNVDAEKEKLLDALACTEDVTLLSRYLDMTIGKNASVRKQDAFIAFNSMVYGINGFCVAKNFLFSRIADIYDYYQPSGNAVGGYIYALGSQMKTKEDLDEMQKFIDRSSAYLKESNMIVQQTIESIKTNVEWFSNFFDKIDPLVS